MEQRKLGTQGLSVSAMGLGCMGMTFAYGAANEAEGIATIHRALDLGINFLDTAEVYGPYTNERLVGRALRGRREGVIVATKFGFRIGDGIRGVDGTPENVKRVANESLARLGIETIDLYYQHRRDPSVPIEETIGAMKELIDEGKVRYLGLSEVSPETLRRANASHPISALQSEYSLWERRIEKEILPAACELGIGLVPYSPLGRGFLTGTVNVDALEDSDFRRSNPRFSKESARANQRIVDVVRDVAQQSGATPAQVALAWVLSRGSDVVPIPGTKRVRYLEENVGALSVTLGEAQLAALDGLHEQTAGERYAPEMMKLVE
ncbi:MAG TPA: aldo/keto reductase [Candidatus Cybelea sp.]|jgi:aryl-alcohol dehydrogenase-like predicted oxidoreductase|nr:aldo/keto reductase [Candidatus Cybelea sp.]